MANEQNINMLANNQPVVKSKVDLVKCIDKIGVSLKTEEQMMVPSFVPGGQPTRDTSTKSGVLPLLCFGPSDLNVQTSTLIIVNEYKPESITSAVRTYKFAADILASKAQNEFKKITRKLDVLKRKSLIIQKIRENRFNNHAKALEFFAKEQKNDAKKYQDVQVKIAALAQKDPAKAEIQKTRFSQIHDIQAKKLLNVVGNIEKNDLTSQNIYINEVRKFISDNNANAAWVKIDVSDLPNLVSLPETTLNQIPLILVDQAGRNYARTPYSTVIAKNIDSKIVNPVTINVLEKFFDVSDLELRAFLLREFAKRETLAILTNNNNIEKQQISVAQEALTIDLRKAAAFKNNSVTLGELNIKVTNFSNDLTNKIIAFRQNHEQKWAQIINPPQK